MHVRFISLISERQDAYIQRNR